MGNQENSFRGQVIGYKYMIVSCALGFSLLMLWICYVKGICVSCFVILMCVMCMRRLGAACAAESNYVCEV